MISPFTEKVTTFSLGSFVSMLALVLNSPMRSFVSQVISTVAFFPGCITTIVLGAGCKGSHSTSSSFTLVQPHEVCWIFKFSTPVPSFRISKTCELFWSWSIFTKSNEVFSTTSRGGLSFWTLSVEPFSLLLPAPPSARLLDWLQPHAMTLRKRIAIHPHRCHITSPHLVSTALDDKE